MENVNTNLEEIFKTLFPTDGLEPEGFCIDARKSSLDSMTGSSKDLR